MTGERRTAVVTGGSTGIGAAIARACLDDGMAVVIGARRDTGIAERLGTGAFFHAMDVRHEEGHRGLIKHALENTGRVDIYINCAGVSSWRPLLDVDEDFWTALIETNLTGTMWGSKAAAAHLPRGGCIVNVSSLAGKRGSANNAVYCAAKFGVNGLTQALAKELGPVGIRVNAVCPVYVVTDGLVAALENTASPAAGRPVGEYLAEFAQNNTALQRVPTGEEVGRVCVFLASEAASAITGQCINVDCGVMPQ